MTKIEITNPQDSGAIVSVLEQPVGTNGEPSGASGAITHLQRGEGKVFTLHHHVRLHISEVPAEHEAESGGADEE